MWAELFLVGTWPFWGLILFLLALECVTIEKEAPVWGAIMLILGVAVLQVFTDANPFGWIVSNPLNALLYVVIYACIGAVYSFLRTALYWNDERKKIRARLASGAKLSNIYVPPFDTTMTDRIITWMVFWPVSLFWTATGRSIKWFFTSLYNLVRNSFTNMYERMFAEFQEPPKPKGKNEDAY